MVRSFGASPMARPSRASSIRWRMRRACTGSSTSCPCWCSLDDDAAHTDIEHRLRFGAHVLRGHEIDDVELVLVEHCAPAHDARALHRAERQGPLVDIAGEIENAIRADVTGVRP